MSLSTVTSSYSPVAAGIDRSQVALIVPTCNASRDWARFSSGIRLQKLSPDQILIVDSSSDDGTAERAEAEGFQVLRIRRCDFNHGGTRQRALQMVPWAEIAVYLTQDAILAYPDSLDRLLSAFEDSEVAAAYGRQLPRPGAGPIEAHARLFNYPPRSEVRTLESRHTLGIKATFLSNSFSAYRVQQLREVGGFPTDVIMAEDALVAGRMLLAGWKTAYVADAAVYHSHAFSLTEEFKRYFDTGVYHREQPWLLEEFGKPSGEGLRFVLSELTHLLPTHPHLVPYALLRTVSKAVGYHLGLREVFGVDWSRRLSYHKNHWNAPRTVQ